MKKQKNTGQFLTPAGHFLVSANAFQGFFDNGGRTTRCCHCLSSKRNILRDISWARRDVCCAAQTSQAHSSTGDKQQCPLVPLLPWPSKRNTAGHFFNSGGTFFAAEKPPKVDLVISENKHSNVPLSPRDLDAQTTHCGTFPFPSRCFLLGAERLPRFV